MQEITDLAPIITGTDIEIELPIEIELSIRRLPVMNWLTHHPAFSLLRTILLTFPGMSSAADVKGIYRSIIDEVVTKSRSEFVQEGVDE